MIFADICGREEGPDALAVQCLCVLRDFFMLDIRRLIEWCEQTNCNTAQLLLYSIRVQRHITWFFLLRIKSTACIQTRL